MPAAQGHNNFAEGHDDDERMPFGQKYRSTAFGSPGELCPRQPDQTCLGDVFSVGVHDQHVDDLAEPKNECQVEEQLDGICRVVLSFSGTTRPFIGQRPTQTRPKLAGGQ